MIPRKAKSPKFWAKRSVLELRMVEKFYGECTSMRSKVPLINHIYEGLRVLKHIGASENAMCAYCLHPILQGDRELAHNFEVVLEHIRDPHVIALVMEYRSVANEYLSGRLDEAEIKQIRLSPIKDVNDMLIADKAQNRKDFELYHWGTHPRWQQLDAYFKLWLRALDISERKYRKLVGIMRA